MLPLKSGREAENSSEEDEESDELLSVPVIDGEKSDLLPQLGGPKFHPNYVTSERE